MWSMGHTAHCRGRQHRLSGSFKERTSTVLLQTVHRAEESFPGVALDGPSGAPDQPTCHVNQDNLTLRTTKTLISVLCRCPSCHRDQRVGSRITRTYSPRTHCRAAGFRRFNQQAAPSRPPPADGAGFSRLSAAWGFPLTQFSGTDRCARPMYSDDVGFVDRLRANRSDQSTNRLVRRPT